MARVGRLKRLNRARCVLVSVESANGTTSPAESICQRARGRIKDARWASEVVKRSKPKIEEKNKSQVRGVKGREKETRQKEMCRGQPQLDISRKMSAPHTRGIDRVERNEKKRKEEEGEIKRVKTMEKQNKEARPKKYRDGTRRRRRRWVCVAVAATHLRSPPIRRRTVWDPCLLHSSLISSHGGRVSFAH